MPFIPFASGINLLLPLDAPDQPSQGAIYSWFAEAAVTAFVGGFILRSIPAGATALVTALGWAAGLSVLGLAAILALCALSTAAYGQEIAEFGDNDNDGDPGDRGENMNGD